MSLNSKILAVVVLVVLFGGIAVSTTLGWWATESTKTPATYTEGEFAGQANPADIRGSYTFGDVSRVFDIPAATLAQAFGVTAEDPAAFALKDLETLYLESPVEIGTASVRLFVACYRGLPYDLATAAETYVPASAAAVINAEGQPTAEQRAWLETHTAPVAAPAPATPEGTVAPVETAAPEGTAAPEPVATPVAAAEDSATRIKGRTTFGELLDWGVSQAAIEEIIGGPLPDPAMKVKDYATAQGLDFETLKLALQAAVDNQVKP